MAITLARNYNNLFDLVKGDDDRRPLIEVAQKACPLIEDMPMQPGTEPSGNKTKLRTKYPRGSWTGLYEGVDDSKSEVSEVTDDCGNLEDYLTIDQKELHLAKDKVKLIADEEKGFIIGLSSTVEENAFYGKKNGKSFTGLAARYNTTDKSKDIGRYVIDAGGKTVGAQASIYFVIWSPLTVYGFHGANAPAGLAKTPKGIITTTAPKNGKKMEGYVEHFNWNVGLAVSDYRSVVRIANIDMNNIEALDLDSLLIKAFGRIKNKTMGSGMIYMSEDVKTAIDLGRNKKSNVLFQPVMWNGNEIEGWRGFGIRTSDMLLSTEDVVA